MTRAAHRLLLSMALCASLLPAVPAQAADLAPLDGFVALEIDLYRFFLARYGDERDLLELRDGNPAKNVAKESEAYVARLDRVRLALTQLARAYLETSDLAHAAGVYDEIARRVTLEEPLRRDGAIASVKLYADLDDRERMLAAQARVFALKPTSAEKAEVDFVVARLEFERWKRTPKDPAQRERAWIALQRYRKVYGASSAAKPFVTEATNGLALMSS